MRDYTKHALAAIVLALCHCVAPCYAGEQASAPTGAQPAEGSASCMTRVWKALLPIVVANNGYLDASDVERIAKIKLSEAVSVSPSDAISSYESNGRFSLSPNVSGSLALTGKASLSLRLELHSEPKAGISLYSWQRLQRRINGTKSSNFDLTCLDGGTPLSLREAESDLEAIGLKRAGALAQPTPVEVFYRDLRGRVDLYYSTPVEMIPTVVSITLLVRRSRRCHRTKSPRKVSPLRLLPTRSGRFGLVSKSRIVTHHEERACDHSSTQ